MCTIITEDREKTGESDRATPINVEEKAMDESLQFKYELTTKIKAAHAARFI